MSYSISNSDFDPSKHKVHTIEVSNEIANPFMTTDTQLFFLVGNELHWINGANALVKLGRLVDFRDEKKILNFVQIKVSNAKMRFESRLELILLAIFRFRQRHGRIKSFLLRTFSTITTFTSFHCHRKRVKRQLRLSSPPYRASRSTGKREPFHFCISNRIYTVCWARRPSQRNGLSINSQSKCFNSKPHLHVLKLQF